MTTCKLVFVGNGAVGKTVFIELYTTNVYPTEYHPTVFNNFVVDITVDGKLIEMAIWDTCGLDDYDRLRPLSYPSTDIFIVAFSINGKDSFVNVREKWIPEIKHHCPKIPWLLLGMKSDLRGTPPEPRYPHVTVQAAKDMAKELGAVGYFECSALTRAGVNEAMNAAVRTWLHQLSHGKKRFNWFRKKKYTEEQGDISTEPDVPYPPTLPEKESMPLININASTFAGDWKRLVNSEELADVAFLLGPKTYHAHKYILCSASEVFRKLLGVEDTVKTTSLGKCPQWNKKRLQDVTPNNICAGKVAGLKDIQYSMNAATGKLLTTVTLDETLVLEVPFMRCLEFLYTGIVELDAKSDDFFDETMKVAELFNLPELQMICENARKGEEDVILNQSIAMWLINRNSGIAKSLFLNQLLLSDVRLMVEGKVIHAHKVVFLARCEVLSAMFMDGFIESEISEVELHDVTYTNMLAFLEYLYTDHSPIEKGDSVGILVLSNKYMMPHLTTLCELYITKEVERATSKCIASADVDIVALLLTAQLHNAPQLSAWCLHFISSNFAAFSTKPEFSLITDDNLTYVKAHQWPPVSYLEAMEEYRKKNEVDGEGESVEQRST